jgi:hypothetical protein
MMICLATDCLQRRGKVVSSKMIQRVVKAVGIMGNPLQTMITLWEAKRCFKTVDEEYRRLKVDACPVEASRVSKGPCSRQSAFFGDPEVGKLGFGLRMTAGYCKTNETFKRYTVCRGGNAGWGATRR